MDIFTSVYVIVRRGAKRVALPRQSGDIKGGSPVRLWFPRNAKTFPPFVVSIFRRPVEDQFVAVLTLSRKDRHRRRARDSVAKRAFL